MNKKIRTIGTLLLFFLSEEQRKDEDEQKTENANVITLQLSGIYEALLSSDQASIDGITTDRHSKQ